MASSDRTFTELRSAIDRRLGTGTLAIYLRTAVTVGSIAARFVAPRHSVWEYVSLNGIMVGLVVLPTTKDLERIYGTRLLAWTVFLLALAVPLFFAIVFSGFALMTDGRTFVSEQVFWGMKIVSLAVAVPCWWGVVWVLGCARDHGRF